MSDRIDMTALGKGDRFLYRGGRYEVTVPASDHPRGWVHVRQLGITDAQAAAMPAEPGCDPRDGLFNFPPGHVQVERIGGAR